MDNFLYNRIQNHSFSNDYRIKQISFHTLAHIIFQELSIFWLDKNVMDYRQIRPLFHRQTINYSNGIEKRDYATLLYLDKQVVGKAKNKIKLNTVWYFDTLIPFVSSAYLLWSRRILQQRLNTAKSNPISVFNKVIKKLILKRLFSET